MSYRLKKAAALILAVIFIISPLIACQSPKMVFTGAVGEFNSNDNIGAPFELTMLDVGQGLSVLVKADGKYMLFDGGGREASSYVVAYLQQAGVKKLEYVFISHYDEDHISGVVGVLNTIKTGKVVCPDYEKDTKIYKSLVNMIHEKKVETEHPAALEEYKLGGATIRVAGPENYNYSEDNDRSIVIQIEYGNFRSIITGDAGKAAESDMVKKGILMDNDVYVVGHHGSANSSTRDFLSVIKPEYSMISCKKDNSYGHPSKTALDNLENIGSKVLRTDILGEITCYSNGESYWFNKESE